MVLNLFIVTFRCIGFSKIVNKLMFANLLNVISWKEVNEIIPDGNPYKCNASLPVFSDTKETFT